MQIYQTINNISNLCLPNMDIHIPPFHTEMIPISYIAGITTSNSRFSWYSNRAAGLATLIALQIYLPPNNQYEKYKPTNKLKLPFRTRMQLGSKRTGQQQHELPVLATEDVPSLSVSLQFLSVEISFLHCSPQSQALPSWKLFLPSSLMATSDVGILGELLSGGFQGLTAYVLPVCAWGLPSQLNNQTPLTTTKTFPSHGLKATIFPSLWKTSQLYCKVILFVRLF